MSDPQRIDISLIVPALNEGPNLRPLVEQIDAALRPGGRCYEVLIVDDNSTDETPAVAAELAKQFPVQLLVRAQPKDGLGGAVLHGMREARGEVFVVMDADLQHPPAKLPELIAPVLAGEADFVLGSRYVPGGSTGEKWGVLRKINSRLATWLARPFTGNVSDPMSGFFALSRGTFERGQRLTPLGYKIGLELMAKCRVRQVREIPIHFAERTRGTSKLTLKEQFRYLEHLSRLYDFHFPRLSPIVKFAIATLLSWFVAFGVFALLMWSFTPGEKISAIQAAIPTSVAYLAAIAATAVFHARYVRTQREFLVRPHPWGDFLLTSIAEWAACTLAAIYLAGRLMHPWPLELLLIPFTIAMLVRYVLRKEFLLDIRGLRHELRQQDII